MLYRDPTASLPIQATQRVGPGETLRPILNSDPTPGPWFHLLSPRSFRWNRATLPVPHLPPALDGLRILHLSDLHLRPRWYAQTDRLLERIADSSPDLILFTGDFIDNRHDCRPSIPSVARFFSALRSPLGVFAIFGNHDQSRRTGPQVWNAYLDPLPLTMIDGARSVIEHRGASIELIGLPGLTPNSMTDDFLANLPPRTDDSIRIILSHYPAQIRRLEAHVPDLFLTGHTHGGQCCLPGGFPLLTHDALPRRFGGGVHRWNDQTWLVVNRGFGFSGPPIRTFCQPEVWELTLKAHEPGSK